MILRLQRRTATGLQRRSAPARPGGVPPPGPARRAGRLWAPVCPVRGDVIHQCRRQAIIGLESEFLEARSDRWQLGRLDAGLDHRGHKRGKSRSGRAAFGEQFGMDEVETIERMALVLDAAVHMGTANLASMPLDRRRRVDHAQLIAVLKNGHVVARDDRDHRKGCSFGFPALGATAGVIVGDIALDADLDRLVRALADEGSAGKVAGALLYSAVNRWVDMNSHGSFLLLFDAS